MTLARLHTVGPRPSEGHRDFANALQGAVRENPISAALIGMGVLWMFMGGSNTSLFGGAGRKSIFRTAMQGAEQMQEAARDTAEHAGAALSRTSNVATGVGSQVAEAFQKASAGATDAVSSVYSAATDGGSRAAEAISDATKATAATMQDTGAKFGSTVQQNLSDLFERHTLLLGAVGLAIGAGIASSVPITEVEKNVVGQTSGLIRDTVLEKVAHVKDMADVVLKEVKSQGLKPEAAGEVLHRLGDTIGVATTAKQSPRQ